MTTTTTESTSGRQRRRDARLHVDWTAMCEKIVEIEQKLDPKLAEVYERVHAEPTGVGTRFPGRVRDISVNGAFIAGEALPLLSRVALVIDVPDFRRVEAVGWVLWRRTAPCTLTTPDGKTVTLEAGFGLIFEWVSLESRIEIARRVAQKA
jgi:hypothetical protein